MVNIEKQNNSIQVNVTTSGQSGNITPSGDSSAYYSDLSRAWAIKTDGTVDGADYSSKYYALLSKGYSEDSSDAKNTIMNNSGFQAVAGDLLGDNTIGLCAQNISSIQSASAQAQLAAEKAVIATEQAQIATQQAASAAETLAGAANTSLSNLTDAGKEVIKDTVGYDDTQTALSNKANADLSNCTRPYVIETYHNSDTSWYRVYSDGWCEQGGWLAGATFVNKTADVVLLKPIKVSDPKPGVTYAYNAAAGSATNVFTSDFLYEGEVVHALRIWTTIYTPNCGWRVWGYVATETEEGE